MVTYEAHEYRDDGDGWKATGKCEVYVADNYGTAVANCLYTHQLVDGKAFIGPSHNTVHVGDYLCYMLTRS